MAQGYVVGNNTGRVDPNNSSTSLLTSGATFTGVGTDAVAFGSIVVSCYTDRTGTLLLEFSTDNTNWDSIITFNVEANINEVHRFSVSKRYYRVVYTNTGTTQTVFRLQALLGSQPQITSALSSIVQQDADALIVRNIDSEIDIANNKYSGYSIVNKMGYNADIDTATTPEDIWELGGVYTGFPLTSGETITVVSTSANDTAAGTGARTLRITGLDTNYTIQTEDFTLNGLTPVIGVKSFVRAHTATVLTSGGSNNSNFNAGVINMYQTVNTSNIFLSMRIGANQTNSSGYTVPAGYTAYVRQIHMTISAVSSQAAAAVDYVMWTQPSLKTSSARLRRPESAYYGTFSDDYIYGGISFPEKNDLIIRVTACNNNNTAVNAGYDLILIKN